MNSPINKYLIHLSLKLIIAINTTLLLLTAITLMSCYVKFLKDYNLFNKSNFALGANSLNDVVKIDYYKRRWEEGVVKIEDYKSS